MLEYFSINKIAFTVMNYPMSYIELFGTMFNLWSVWLIAKKKMLTWPTGIIGAILFGILFYQIRLYSDTIEQIYYVLIGIYGWWAWNKVKVKEEIPVMYSTFIPSWFYIFLTLTCTIFLGLFISNIHTIMPQYFPEKASFPYLDALTTVMSFVAMWLMTMRKCESWIYWIIVDVIGICLYYVKDVKFVSGLYLIFLCIAINGLITWHKSINKKELLV